MHTDKLFVSVRDAARLTSLSRTTLYKMLKLNRLSRVKAGRRTLITVESLNRLIKEAQ